MKKEGSNYSYTLDLVDAESKVPFPEHSDATNACTYVEVEPDAEYLVRVNVRDANGGRRVKLFVELNIDGEMIRRSIKTWKSSENGLYFGFRSYYDGIRTETSFKFDKIATTSTISTNVKQPVVVRADDNAASPVGDVSVSFYEAVKNRGGTRKVGRMARDTPQAWAGQNVAVGAGSDGKKKLLKTTSGTTVIGVKEVFSRSRYHRGKLIESIQLKYCTAQGLIRAGIWPSISATASQGSVDVIDVTDEDEMPAKKKRATIISGVVDLTDD